MKKQQKQKEQSWRSTLKTVLFVIAFIAVVILISKLVDENEQYNINTNYCNSESSCLCRDTCTELYGVSDWNNWHYEISRTQTKCSCVNGNESKVIW